MDNQDTNPWPKSRITSERKEKIIKRLKTWGKEHVNHVVKTVPAKYIGDIYKKVSVSTIFLDYLASVMLLLLLKFYAAFWEK